MPQPHLDLETAPDLPDLRDADVRLVVTDMDGTLLDAHGEIPAGLWPVLGELTARGITFVPASGRQHASLTRQFGPAGADLVYICENGGLVVHGDRVISSVHLDPALVRAGTARVRAAAREGLDVGLVVSGRRCAYVERDDPRFLEQVAPYYAALQVVPDLDAVDDVVLKLAAFDFGAAATGLADRLQGLVTDPRVIISSAHWVDVMHPDADKGRALSALQGRLGVGPEHTMVFGDYLNDLGMLDQARYSFAMADAHPEVFAHARYVAPSHRDAGVVRVLQALLER